MSSAHFMLESGLADWQQQHDAISHSDSWSIGNTLLRVGLGSAIEAQFGWQVLGLTRTTDLTTHSTETASQTGDVTLGLLYGLSGTDGPAAVQLFVSLPAGKAPIGAGDWGAGARLRYARSLGHDWQLGLTPEIDAAVNQSGRGRHLAYGGAMGIGHPVTPHLSFGVDISVMRDEDPAGPTTRIVTTASLAWQLGTNTQFDIGGGTGLNRDSLDKQLYFGIARRF